MSKLDWSKIPKFADLPVKADAPPGSNWGVFGDDDQIGCLNFLTPEGVLDAARLGLDRAAGPTAFTGGAGGPRSDGIASVPGPH